MIKKINIVTCSFLLIFCTSCIKENLLNQILPKSDNKEKIETTIDKSINKLEKTIVENSISGIVKDAVTGVAISDSIVKIDDKEVKTGSAGEYFIKDIEPGNKIVIIKKDGYENFSSEIILKKGSQVKNFYLIKEGNPKISFKIDPSLARLEPFPDKTMPEKFIPAGKYKLSCTGKAYWTYENNHIWEYASVGIAYRDPENNIMLSSVPLGGGSKEIETGEGLISAFFIGHRNINSAHGEVILTIEGNNNNKYSLRVSAVDNVFQINPRGGMNDITFGEVSYNIMASGLMSNGSGKYFKSIGVYYIDKATYKFIITSIPIDSTIKVNPILHNVLQFFLFDDENSYYDNTGLGTINLVETNNK